METVAEENPLRSATSRIVTAACDRLRDGSEVELWRASAPRDFPAEDFRVGFESEDSMGLLECQS
jgi:hypothetical protein